MGPGWFIRNNFLTAAKEPNFNYNPQIVLDGERVSFAICADIADPQHISNAKDNNASLYIASIFYTPKEIDECHRQLSSYARAFSMNILMADFAGPSYGLKAAGFSAFWSKSGAMIKQMNGFNKGLLLVNIEKDTLHGHTVFVESE